LNRQPYDFHYEIQKFVKDDGVYIVRKDGRGFRTDEEESNALYNNGWIHYNE